MLGPAGGAGRAGVCACGAALRGGLHLHLHLRICTGQRGPQGRAVRGCGGGVNWICWFALESGSGPRGFLLIEGYVQGCVACKPCWCVDVRCWRWRSVQRLQLHRCHRVAAAMAGGWGCLECHVPVDVLPPSPTGALLRVSCTHAC